MTNKSLLILLAIILLSAIIRLFKLSEIPPGLYWDEMSIGYNAYSIALTGKDEHGVKFPQLFKAYGEYKLPVYIYFTSASIFLFGRSDFAVRFPSALAGTFSVLLTYFLVVKLFPKYSKGMLPLLAAFTMAINPWHIHLSHAGFETNLALFFLLGGVLFFLNSLSRSRYFLTFSVILFFLAANTYNSYRVFVPLIIISLLLIYRNEIIKKINNVIGSLVVGIFGILIMLPQFVSGDAFVRVKTESIFGKDPTLTSFLQHYLANFDTTYLFFKGDQNGRHSVRKLGMLHAYELALIFIGLVFILKDQHNSQANKLLFSWILLGPIPSALTTINPHALRSLNILPAWIILSAIGLMQVIIWIKKHYNYLKYVLLSLLIFTVSYSIMMHLHQYLIHYTNEAALDWNDGFKETVDIIKANYDKFDTIYLTDFLAPVYLGYYLPLDPNYYQQLETTRVIGKINYFTNLYDVNKQPGHKSLFIGSESQRPGEGVKYQEIKMLNRDTIFNIWEE